MFSPLHGVATRRRAHLLRRDRYRAILLIDFSDGDFPVCKIHESSFRQAGWPLISASPLIRTLTLVQKYMNSIPIRGFSRMFPKLQNDSFPA